MLSKLAANSLSYLLQYLLMFILSSNYVCVSKQCNLVVSITHCIYLLL